MSLIDRVNSACVKARKEGKFSFSIQCMDWEPIYRYMAAEIRLNEALSEQDEAMQEIKD